MNYIIELELKLNSMKSKFSADNIFLHSTMKHIKIGNSQLLYHENAYLRLLEIKKKIKKRYMGS